MVAKNGHYQCRHWYYSAMTIITPLAALVILTTMMAAIVLVWLADVFTPPAQCASQAVSDDHTDDVAYGTHGVVLAAIINIIMGKTLQ